ncbi:hypothetical protein V5O48_001987, partial [Marasmius crinis-equi]
MLPRLTSTSIPLSIWYHSSWKCCPYHSRLSNRLPPTKSTFNKSDRATNNSRFKTPFLYDHDKIYRVINEEGLTSTKNA